MFVIKSFDEMPVTIADIIKHTDADKTLCLLKITYNLVPCQHGQ